MNEPFLLPGNMLAGRYVVRTILAVGQGWAVVICDLPLGAAFKRYLGYIALDAGEEGKRRAHARLDVLFPWAPSDPRLAPLDFGVDSTGHHFLLIGYTEGMDHRAFFPGPVPERPRPGDLCGQYVIERVLDRDELGVYYAATFDALGLRARLYVLHEHLASSAEHAQRLLATARDTLQPDVRDVGRLEDGRPFLVLKA